MLSNSSFKSLLLCIPAVLLAGCSLGTFPPSTESTSAGGATSTVAGGNTPTPTPGPTQVPVVASITQPSIYFPDSTSDQPVVRIVPKAVTSSPVNTVFGSLPSIDGAGNVYVYTGSSITEYDPTSVNGTPLRVLPTGKGTNITTVVDMMASQSGEIFVFDGTGIAVFNSTANGNDKPIRYLNLPTASAPNSTFTLDRFGNLYLSNEAGVISVFDASTNGSVQPIRTIQGPSTHLSLTITPQFLNVFSMATDKDGSLYAVGFWQGTGLPGAFAILEFPANANGNAAPIATFWTPEMYPWTAASSIAVDAGGTVYLTAGTGTGAQRVFEFAPNTANTNIATASFGLAAWTDTETYRMAVNY